MAIETFGFIDDLNAANPTATDNVSEGDDHIRGIKATLKSTFPNVTGAINATETELNYVDGVTSAIQTQLNNKEAADATILKDADIGVTVLSPTGDGSGLTGIDALPSQATHAGKYLTTDATTASWATLDTDANSTTKGLYEHANTISANYTITTGNNALTAGPITINTGVSVTVPTGSTWVVA